MARRADTRSDQVIGTQDGADEAAAPLDALLVGAALGPLRRLTPDASTLRWAGELGKHPGSTARRLGALGQETLRIVRGRSSVEPARGDRRFKDVAWTENPLLHRLAQSYLAGAETAGRLVEDADLDWRDKERTRFLVQNLSEALAPSNLPLVNPASAKAAIDSGGRSLARGAAQLVKDLRSSPRVPEMVDTSGFTVGENVANTPGAVVLRTEVFELIQYTPQTPKVFEVPVLVVPPTINKFYAIDLATGRSLVDHSVKGGRQMFVMSWRNPDRRHADWNFDTYVGAILEALSAVERITGSSRTVLGGICSGGILASITAAYLAHQGQQDRLAAFLLAVTVIDNAHAGTTSALTDRNLAELAKAKSRQDGYLDGRALAEIFAWLRPGDLIWNYWVNNYLLGRRPPAFDILFWNSDTTRMAAGLHADFVDLSMENSLTRPDALTVLGVPIDLGRVTVDSYVVAGVTDHITPWENCYRTTQLLGGDVRFVLSTSGHIAALVNPPDNPKASFRSAPGDSTENPADSREWLAEAVTQQGSWWTDVAAWLDKRTGRKVAAPKSLGSAELPVLGEAPGTYVMQS